MTPVISTTTDPAGTTDAARPRRVDAQRNRDKVLAAALELFAEAGTEVPLETIAGRAGVGIATLYRNFPSRDSLVAAAYRSEVAQLIDSAAELLAEYPPDEALDRWMDRYVHYAVAKRGMGDALRAMIESGNDVYGDTREQLTGALAVLLEAGAAAGSLRADVNAEDVLFSTASIFFLPRREGWEDQGARVLRLVTDGLRYRAREKPCGKEGEP